MLNPQHSQLTLSVADGGAGLFLSMFLPVYAPCENFLSHVDVTIASECLCSAFMSIEQQRFFNVPYLSTMTQTFILKSSSRTNDIHTCSQAF